MFKPNEVHNHWNHSNRFTQTQVVGAAASLSQGNGKNGISPGVGQGQEQLVFYWMDRKDPDILCKIQTDKEGLQEVMSSIPLPVTFAVNLHDWIHRAKHGSQFHLGSGKFIMAVSISETQMPGPVI